MAPRDTVCPLGDSTMEIPHRSHRFQMRGIHAGANHAQMVQMEARRDLPDQHLPQDTVGQLRVTC